MSKKHKRMLAHPNTYFVGNIIILTILWIAVSIMIWHYLFFWWPIKIAVLLVALIVLAGLQYRYLTIMVGRFVEKFFPDSETTDRYRENQSKMDEVHHRGHW